MKIIYIVRRRRFFFFLFASICLIFFFVCYIFVTSVRERNRSQKGRVARNLKRTLTNSYCLETTDHVIFVRVQLILTLLISLVCVFFSIRFRSIFFAARVAKENKNNDKFLLAYISQNKQTPLAYLSPYGFFECAFLLLQKRRVGN